jgi:hypothetical protein
MDSTRAINYLPKYYCRFLVAFYREHLAADPEDQPYGCMIPEKKCSSGDGYVKVTLHRDDFERAGVSEDVANQLFETTTERDILLHVVAYKAEHGNVPDGRSVHVSHLCAERACFNPKHLASDSAMVNNSRKNCKRAVIAPQIEGQEKRLIIRTCTGHGSHYKCILPQKFYNDEEYSIIDEEPDSPKETIGGKGANQKQARKTVWEVYRRYHPLREEKKTEE